jgi:uncharacterized membrane protein
LLGRPLQWIRQIKKRKDQQLRNFCFHSCREQQKNSIFANIKEGDTYSDVEHLPQKNILFFLLFRSGLLCTFYMVEQFRPQGLKD